MKSATCLLAILAIFGLMIPVASAQEETQFSLNPNEGLYDGLARQGCNPGWLSLVMSEDNIKLEDLRRLWKPVAIDMTQCKETPPEEVLAATRRIVKADIAAAASARKRSDGAQQSVASNRAAGHALSAPPIPDTTIHEREDLQAKLDAANATIQGLQAKLDAANATIQSMKSADVPKENAAAGTDHWSVLAIVATAVSITAVILGGLFFLLWRRKPTRSSMALFGDAGSAGKGAAKISRLEADLVASERARIELVSRLGTAEESAAALKTERDTAQAVVTDLTTAIQGAVFFDREIEVRHDGVAHTFVLVGVEAKRDGNGFVGLYACPLCTERRLVLPEGLSDQQQQERLALHFTKCPDMKQPGPIAVPPPRKGTLVGVA
ncbi:MAG: hypothetical protein ABSC29_02185 [Minisyncoccia bacterium]|jgi:hypothetical protein